MFDVLTYLSSMYSATYVPILCLKEQETVAVFPEWAKDILLKLDSDERHGSNGLDFDFFQTNDLLYVGIIRNLSAGNTVIVGPVSSIPVTKCTIKSILRSNSFDAESEIHLAEFFDRTPQFTIYQLLNIMNLIYTELNGKSIDVLDKYYTINSNVESEVGSSNIRAMIERKENESFRNTYFLEREFFCAIEKGDVAKIETLSKNVSAFTEGIMAADHLRQAKNIFISTITLACRSAITGGFDIESAYQMEESYISMAESMNNIPSITLLNMNALIDYAKRVSKVRFPGNISSSMFNCLQYISNHTNKRITVEGIADELNINRCVLSKKFKDEMGINISSYIIKKKLEEAESLLCYTDKTISEISNYLWFATQSHFQNVFKKQYGITPKEYRLKNRGSYYANI